MTININNFYIFKINSDNKFLKYFLLISRFFKKKLIHKKRTKIYMLEKL